MHLLIFWEFPHRRLLVAKRAVIANDRDEVSRNHRDNKSEG